jgi:hypothetical protein
MLQENYDFTKINQHYFKMNINMSYFCNICLWFSDDEKKIITLIFIELTLDVIYGCRVKK